MWNILDAVLQLVIQGSQKKKTTLAAIFKYFLKLSSQYRLWKSIRCVVRKIVWWWNKTSLHAGKHHMTLMKLWSETLKLGTLVPTFGHYDSWKHWLRNSVISLECFVSGFSSRLLHGGHARRAIRFEHFFLDRSVISLMFINVHTFRTGCLSDLVFEHPTQRQCGKCRGMWRSIPCRQVIQYFLLSLHHNNVLFISSIYVMLSALSHLAASKGGEMVSIYLKGGEHWRTQGGPRGHVPPGVKNLKKFK